MNATVAIALGFVATFLFGLVIGHISGISIGETVMIRYLPASPEKSRIDSFAQHWGLALAMGFASLVLVAVGFWVRWRRARDQRWADRMRRETSPNAGSEMRKDPTVDASR